MGLVINTQVTDSIRGDNLQGFQEAFGAPAALHTFVFDGHIPDDHEMSSALTSEVVLRAFFQFPGVFVPRNDRVVKGHFALEGGRLPFMDFDVVDAFGEMNLFS